MIETVRNSMELMLKETVGTDGGFNPVRREQEAL